MFPLLKSLSIWLIVIELANAMPQREEMHFNMKKMSQSILGVFEKNSTQRSTGSYQCYSGIDQDPKYVPTTTNNQGKCNYATACYRVTANDVDFFSVSVTGTLYDCDDGTICSQIGENSCGSFCNVNVCCCTGDLCIPKFSSFIVIPISVAVSLFSFIF